MFRGRQARLNLYRRLFSRYRVVGNASQNWRSSILPYISASGNFAYRAIAPISIGNLISPAACFVLTKFMHSLSLRFARVLICSGWPTLNSCFNILTTEKSPRVRSANWGALNKIGEAIRTTSLVEKTLTMRSALPFSRLLNCSADYWIW